MEPNYVNHSPICYKKLAESEGFEPSMEFNPHTPLAGEPLQPLGQLSAVHINDAGGQHNGSLLPRQTFSQLSVSCPSISSSALSARWMRW